MASAPTPTTKTTKAEPQPKKRGRPSLWSEEIAKEICDRLAQGEPLAVICRDDHMPNDDTVRNWKEVHEGFDRAIAHAREIGFDKIAADCLDIADDGTNDYVAKERPDGSKYDAFDAEHVQRSKLRIETRLKLLAKWDPKRYGERIDLNHSGSVNTQTDEQLDARIALLSAKLRSADDANGEG